MNPISIVTGTREHLDGIVALHMEGFPPDENIVTALGRGVVRRAYWWFVDNPGAEVFVALDQARPIGFMALAAGSYARRVTLRVLPWALAAVLRHPGLAFRGVLHRRAVRLFQRGAAGLPPGARAAYLAVTPRARGRGIGHALNLAAIEWCRQRRIERIVTGVHRDNVPSLRMNERVGFVTVPELRRGDMLIQVLTVAGPPAGNGPDSGATPGPDPRPEEGPA